MRTFWGLHDAIASSDPRGALAIALAGGLTAAAVSQAAPEAPAVSYTADGKLDFPKDYRDLGLSLDRHGHVLCRSARATVGQHTFDNVFVNRAAYAAYQKTGTWPDKTIFMLEVRTGRARGSINKNGLFQTDGLGVEAHVKDIARFKSGWAFFPSAAATARRGACRRPRPATPATSSMARWTPPSCSSTRRCRPRRRR